MIILIKILSIGELIMYVRMNVSFMENGYNYRSFLWMKSYSKTTIKYLSSVDSRLHIDTFIHLYKYTYILLMA